MVEKQWKQNMSLFQTGCGTITVKYNLTNFLYNIFSYFRVMWYSTYSRTVFKIYKKQACKLRVSERWILNFNPSKVMDLDIRAQKKLFIVSDNWLCMTKNWQTFAAPKGLQNVLNLVLI